MSYPELEDDNFYSRINRKYKRYTIPKKKKTFNQICFPKEYKLQPQQELLAKYVNPKTDYKGLLVFHRIGAGKTCTAVNICEQWKGIRKIIVVVPASLVGNFRDELRSPCAGNNYLTGKEREQLKKLHPLSDKYISIIKESDKRINKYYKIYSYNKFVDLAMDNKIKLNKSILVVDEIQNMVSETGIYYKTLYNTIHNAPRDLRIVLLSATPMYDKPIEIALTMNLLRLPYELPTGREFDNTFLKINKKKDGKVSIKAKNLDMFKEMTKGYVSYYRGAPPHVFPEERIKYVRCEMSDYQYKSYLAVLEKEEKKAKKSSKSKSIQGFRVGDILKLPNNFFIGTRIISNIAFPNRMINADGFECLKKKHLEINNLETYSTKFYNIIKRIKRSQGPVFVYSNFKEYGGIKSFVKVLEAHGYVNYSDYGEGRKRFAIWSSDIKTSDRETIKAVFNQRSNKNGSKIKIMCGTPSISEGVSLLSVRQVHLLEPYWNQSKIDQIIGRAVRYCSHKYLEEDRRIVNVYIYIATHPNEKITIDEYILKMSQSKNKLIKEFELALKESAIDCTLFKNANVFKNEGEDDIICEK